MDSGYDYQGYIAFIVYAYGGYDIVSEKGQYFYTFGKDGQGSRNEPLTRQKLGVQVLLDMVKYDILYIL